MTYDYAGAWTDTVWHHTNLRAPIGPGASHRGTDLAVEQHLRAGVPRNKLVVGVAFYGRGWRDVDGLNRPASDSVFDLPYHGITELARSDTGFVRQWDEDALSPYLWNESRRAFISYDDTVSLRLKSDFIREEGLGGAMYWENSADTTGALLTTLHRYLRETPDQSGE